jgi:hypothetical protein
MKAGYRAHPQHCFQAAESLAAAAPIAARVVDKPVKHLIIWIF